MDVLSRERRGDYLGATIQVIPHVTDTIKNLLKVIYRTKISFMRNWWHRREYRKLAFFEAIGNSEMN